MIAIADLEQTPEYRYTLTRKFGDRGFYKQSVPRVVREFAEPFTRTHVEAVLLRAIGKQVADYERKRLADGVRQQLYYMEDVGDIEKTGKFQNGRVLYRRKV